jgi:hypothetical protein
MKRSSQRLGEHAWSDRLSLKIALTVFCAFAACLAGLQFWGAL